MGLFDVLKALIIGYILSINHQCSFPASILIIDGAYNGADYFIRALGYSTYTAKSSTRDKYMYYLALWAIKCSVEVLTWGRVEPPEVLRMLFTYPAMMDYIISEHCSVVFGRFTSAVHSHVKLALCNVIAAACNRMHPYNVFDAESVRGIVEVVLTVKKVDVVKITMFFLASRFIPCSLIYAAGARKVTYEMVQLSINRHMWADLKQPGYVYCIIEKYSGSSPGTFFAFIERNKHHMMRFVSIWNLALLGNHWAVVPLISMGPVLAGGIRARTLIGVLVRLALLATLCFVEIPVVVSAALTEGSDMVDIEMVAKWICSAGRIALGYCARNHARDHMTVIGLLYGAFYPYICVQLGLDHFRYCLVPSFRLQMILIYFNLIGYASYYDFMHIVSVAAVTGLWYVIWRLVTACRADLEEFEVVESLHDFQIIE